MYAHVVGIHACPGSCVHITVESGAQPQVCSSGTLSLWFWFLGMVCLFVLRWGDVTAWNSPVRLGQFGSECQGSSCLHTPCMYVFSSRSWHSMWVLLVTLRQLYLDSRPCYQFSKNNVSPNKQPDDHSAKASPHSFNTLDGVSENKHVLHSSLIWFQVFITGPTNNIRPVMKETGQCVEPWMKKWILYPCFLIFFFGDGDQMQDLGYSKEAHYIVLHPHF